MLIQTTARALNPMLTATSTPPHCKTSGDSQRPQNDILHTPATPTRHYTQPERTFECSPHSSHAGMADEPPSPPASPWAVHAKKNASFGYLAEPNVPHHHRDPLLYRGSLEDISQEPLFSSMDKLAPVTDWREDIAYHFVKPKSKKDPRRLRYRLPTQHEHSQAVLAAIRFCRVYNSNPGGHLRKALDEVSSSRSTKRARIVPPPASGSRILKPLTLSSTGEAQKPAEHSPKKLSRARKLAAPIVGHSINFSDRPRVPHTRAPSIKRPEDVHFASLPDFSPPISGLPNSKALKIEWSSHNALDLSADPHRHLLHDAELSLASTLRLSCATYLCSKRRIFMKVRDAYKIGKEFRKTDAQQACQIDVNKASKLWVAFEKVGWFSRAHFQKCLSGANRW